MSTQPSFSQGNFCLYLVSEEEIHNLPDNFSKKEDLNDFFKNDCLDHDKQLLTKTYKFVHKDFPDDIIGLVSLSNDALTLSKSEKRKNIHHEKRGYDDYPAVKIARLAIRNEMDGKGFGTFLINLIKRFFLTNNKTGCRFVTVDAYKDVLGFYQKNQFIEIKEQLTHEEEEAEETKSMFYNLENVDLS